MLFHLSQFLNYVALRQLVVSLAKCIQDLLVLLDFAHPSPFKQALNKPSSK